MLISSCSSYWFYWMLKLGKRPRRGFLEAYSRELLRGVSFWRDLGGEFMVRVAPKRFFSAPLKSPSPILHTVGIVILLLLAQPSTKANAPQKVSWLLISLKKRRVFLSLFALASKSWQSTARKSFSCCLKLTTSLLAKFQLSQTLHLFAVLSAIMRSLGRKDPCRWKRRSKPMSDSLSRYSVLNRGRSLRSASLKGKCSIYSSNSEFQPLDCFTENRLTLTMGNSVLPRHSYVFASCTVCARGREMVVLRSGGRGISRWRGRSFIEAQLQMSFYWQRLNRILSSSLEFIEDIYILLSEIYYMLQH